MSNQPASSALLLRPGTEVLHGLRAATVLSVDADPTAHVWVVYRDNPDEDAMLHREELSELCAICDRAPASVDAIDDDRPVHVCKGCFEYYADGEGL